MKKNSIIYATIWICVILLLLGLWSFQKEQVLEKDLTEIYLQAVRETHRDALEYSENAWTLTGRKSNLIDGFENILQTGYSKKVDRMVVHHVHRWANRGKEWVREIDGEIITAAKGSAVAAALFLDIGFGSLGTSTATAIGVIAADGSKEQEAEVRFQDAFFELNRYLIENGYTNFEN